MNIDSQKINSAYRALLSAAKNTVSPEDNKVIRRALDLAIEACGDKVILTGEPEILHALSVARIIAGEMGLGLTSIVTALLHYSYANLSATPKELEKEFGKKVVEISDPNKGWDGRQNNGQKSDEGVYYWEAVIGFTDGKSINKQGTVTLLR